MLVYLIFIIIKITLIYTICISGENYCTKCNPITKLCVKCEREIYSPNIYGGCDIIKQCTIGNNYCLECQENNNLCKRCEIGYFPDEYGGCSYSTNCELSFQGKCLKCKKNNTLVGIENYSYEGIIICKSLNSDDFLNCASIDPLIGKCINCAEGYFLNSIDRKCTKTENCTKSSFGLCKECLNGYYLDKKENICKKQNEKFENCKISIDGIKCSECIYDYYFDDDGNCINMNFCAKKGDDYQTCGKCIDKYYLSEKDSICTTTDNCMYGNKHSGICEMCKENYYMDYKDGKCYSNQENNVFKYCKIVNESNICVQCQINYYMGNDNKCSISKNCLKSENGICISCKNNYYLGLDHICTNIEHCIYSENYECFECEDNYYYDQNYKKCISYEDNYNFTNCKYSALENDYCERCKNDYYLNETDHQCYNNKEIGKFYKCAINYANSDICDICVEGYHLGYKDKKCSKIEGCGVSENENNCIECDEDYYCLNIKNGNCIINDRVISEDKKYFYKCNRTNEEGNGCEICIEGFNLNNEGLCVDEIHCEEKNDGVCVKCQEGFCLNNMFGCVEMFFDNCLECNYIFNMEICTKCYDGYEVDEFDTCSKI